MWLNRSVTTINATLQILDIVRAENETVGLNLTWAHNLFIEWALGFPTLGRSQHRNSE